MLKSNNSGRIITNSEGKKSIHMKIILICLYVII